MLEFGSSLLSELFGLKAVAAAESLEQQWRVLFRPVPLSEGAKDSVQANRKQGIALELFLMAQQVQLNKELVSKPAVQGSNDVRELLMKIALAVSDGLTVAQLLIPNRW